MGSATAASGLGEWLRKAQNGNVRSYGLILGAGVIVLALVALLGQLG
jgi:NADH-quinone oxidoreductase subunit L